MYLSEHPLTYYGENKFVITENRAYFIPYRRELDYPGMKAILAEVFDLEDPKVYEDVRARFSEGTIIVGSYFPSTKQRIIDTPPEANEYVEKRLQDVFGDV